MSYGSGSSTIYVPSAYQKIVMEEKVSKLSESFPKIKDCYLANSLEKVLDILLETVTSGQDQYIKGNKDYQNLFFQVEDLAREIGFIWEQLWEIRKILQPVEVLDSDVYLKANEIIKSILINTYGKKHYLQKLLEDTSVMDGNDKQMLMSILANSND